MGKLILSSVFVVCLASVSGVAQPTFLLSPAFNHWGASLDGSFSGPGNLQIAFKATGYCGVYNPAATPAERRFNFELIYQPPVGCDIALPVLEVGFRHFNSSGSSGVTNYQLLPSDSLRFGFSPQGNEGEYYDIVISLPGHSYCLPTQGEPWAYVKFVVQSDSSDIDWHADGGLAVTIVNSPTLSAQVNDNRELYISGTGPGMPSVARVSFYSADGALLDSRNVALGTFYDLPQLDIDSVVVLWDGVCHTRTIVLTDIPPIVTGEETKLKIWPNLMGPNQSEIQISIPGKYQIVSLLSIVWAEHLVVGQPGGSIPIVSLPPGVYWLVSENDDHCAQFQVRN